MTPRTLEQFLAVADLRHFGRASEQSNVSHSALSRSIRQLEDEVGARLFDRDNRSVSLTSDGEAFVDYARDALHRWNEIRQNLQGSDGQVHGEISLYCSVTASHSMPGCKPVMKTLPSPPDQLPSLAGCHFAPCNPHRWCLSRHAPTRFPAFPTTDLQTMSITGAMYR